MSSSARSFSRDRTRSTPRTYEVVGDIIARYPLVVESPRQSPGPGKSLPKRRAQRQYLSRFDVLDVGKDDRPEIHGKSAKAVVQVDHLAPICTATRGWVVTTALGRLLFAERKFPRKKRTEIRTECRISAVLAL
jgi:hypothetical protein